MDDGELVAWARAEADRVLDDMVSTSAAVEFLRRQGAGAIYDHARAASEQVSGSSAAGYANPAARHEVSTCLVAWADFAASGMASAQPFELRARSTAATDLMEQVQILLDDPKVHPAAPVVLAGAAIEEFLRGLVATSSADVKGKPGLNTYATALQATHVLDAQDVKNITAWAGLRNHAAHGEFEDVPREEARIMAAGVNLFLQQRS